MISREEAHTLLAAMIEKVHAANADKSNRRKQEAAIEAHYDFAVALGIDKFPQFIESELEDFIKTFNPSPAELERARKLVISDLEAARKRAQA